MNNSMTLTVEEVAVFLKLSPITVYRELTRKHLPGFKVGNQWRVRQDILEEWIEEKSGWTRRFDRLWSTLQKEGKRRGVTEEMVNREVQAVRKGKP